MKYRGIMTELHQIGMLWMRGSLSYLEQLCVQSFLDAGHHVVLYTYDPVDRVPDGTELRSADDILPETGTLVHERTGSPAVQADLFRYNLLQETDDLIWADTDAYCRKPFVTETGHFFGWESKKHINNGILGLPRDSRTLELILDYCADEFAIPPWYGADYVKELEEKKAAGNPVHAGAQPWGVWGPHAVTYFLKKTGDSRYAFPQDVLYPFSFKDRRKMVKPNIRISDYITDNTCSVHLYGRRMRRFLTVDYKGIPDPAGLLGQLLIKHRINPLDAPLRDYPNPDPNNPFAKVFREEIDGKRYPVEIAPAPDTAPLDSVVGITTMKNEGPYILDWIAYHLWIGFTHFLVYTNDCSDGTDEILDRLSQLGLVTRIDNPARTEKGERPQRVALALAQDHPILKSADAYMVFDVDEYINIHTPEGTLRSLMEATDNPELIAMTWRFFGSSGVSEFSDTPVPLQFDRCAPQKVRFPHQNWGFKTFARQPSSYTELGIHRPLSPVSDEMPLWVNGSGTKMPERYRKKGWRSSLASWGYDLVTLNHYSIRSLDSYLIKRDRGRTNHINRDHGLEYWNIHNRNDEQDRSIQDHFARALPIRDNLSGDPDLARLHAASCDWHRARTNVLKQDPQHRDVHAALAQNILSHKVSTDGQTAPRRRDISPASTPNPKTPEVADSAPKGSGRPILLGADAQQAYERLRRRNAKLHPELTPAPPASRDKISIVTTMRNEAPFLLEWIAYHRSIGVTDFLIYTNDCTDETVELLDRLQSLGYVTRLDNPFKSEKGQRPQRGALNHAVSHPLIRKADWHICMDCDEFINIHVGQGTLPELFAAMNEPNVVSLTWKLFGNAGVTAYQDKWVIETFDHCAPQFLRKPGMIWGFKSLVHKSTPYAKLGVHRPLEADKDRLSDVRWVNGSGRMMPDKHLSSNSWRSTKRTLGYDLVTLNHYTLRSADSYLVKRERGRVNHVDEDMGEYYWNRRNYNSEHDDRILQHVPRARKELDRIMADPDIATLHQSAVLTHERKVRDLKALPEYARLYEKISAPDQQDALFMPERSEPQTADT